MRGTLVKILHTQHQESGIILTFAENAPLMNKVLLHTKTQSYLIEASASLRQR